MLRIINTVIILLFSFSSLAQSSDNPAVSNVQINTDFSPSAIKPIGGAPQQQPVTSVGNNKNPFNLNLNVAGSNANTNIEDNPKVIQAGDPFGYAKKSPQGQQPANNGAPYDNYEFTRKAIEDPNHNQDKVEFVFDSNLTNKDSELYKRANNPNGLIENSINQAAPQFKEKKEVCDTNGGVCIIYFISDKLINVEVQNNLLITSTISLVIWNKNSEVTLKIKDPDKIIVRGKERVKIAEITRLSANESFSFNFNFNSIEGFVDAIHNDNYIYSLPFEVSQSFKMVQGYGGTFSHDDEENYFAYDFRMPVGTPVYATREGVIVRVKDGFARGGLDKTLRQKANFIHIEHEDGTVGVYGHLMQSGAIVKVGDYVQRGQKIGYSGNTGYTGSPHLHFAVVKVKRSGKFQSVQIKMRTPTGIEEKLKDNTYYSR